MNRATHVELVDDYPPDWPDIACEVKAAANWRCIRCDHPNDSGSGYGLGVHHFNGVKPDCRWWNLLALCQRCHLSVQARVNPEQAFFADHSEWIKPYVAGFYASKYLGEELKRDEVEERLEELLNLELAIFEERLEELLNPELAI